MRRTLIAPTLIALLVGACNDSSSDPGEASNQQLAARYEAALADATLSLEDAIALATEAYPGAVVIEAVFDWKGIGSLLVDSVLKRDYPVIEGAVFLTATAAVLGTRLGDWAQSATDPRVSALDDSDAKGEPA